MLILAQVLFISNWIGIGYSSHAEGMFGLPPVGAKCRFDNKERDLTDIDACGKIMTLKMVLIAWGRNSREINTIWGEGCSRGHACQLDAKFCGLTYLNYKVMR